MATAISQMTALSSIATGDHFPVVDISDTTQSANGTTKRTTFATLAAAVIASDAEVAALGGLTSAADRLPYFTGSGTASLATFTAGGRAIVNSAGTADTFPYFSASNTVTLGSITAAGRAILDDADASAQRTTLGLAIGTNVQAFDAELAAIAGLVSAADSLPYFTGSGTASLATFTAAGRALVDDADAAAQMTTLGMTANGQSLVTAADYAAMKTLLSLNSVENTALSTWAGSTNVTTLGTIGTGTWNATAIGVTKGGTGLTAIGSALQVLRVNAGGTALEYAAASGGAAALDDLTDVVITTPSNGQVLKYNGSNWINDTDATGGGGSVTITGTPADNQLAVWTGSSAIEGDAALSFNTATDQLTVGAGSLTRVGAHTLTLTTSATTDVTFPTAGTLATLAGTETLTNKTLTSPVISSIVNTGTLTMPTSTDTLVGRSTTDTLANKTLSAPSLSGIWTTNGAQVTTANAMGALAIDVTKGLNTKSVAADSTFTFSATPSTDTWFGLWVKNTDTNPHTLTIPSSRSMTRGVTVTTVSIPASSEMFMTWRYDGTTYQLLTSDGYLNKWDATAAPAVTDDVSKGYGPGSMWGNATGNTLYWCESNSVGAAVWNQAGGGGTLTDGDKGDITVSASGATWTIDNTAVSYAKIQNISATARVLGRKTAGAGVTEEVTLSQLLDFVGSAAQGDILYRGASTWTRLGAGTSGQFLQTQGAGANPQWSSPAGSGDVSSNTATSVDSEIALFNSTTGKSIKRAAVTGMLKATSGVLAAATAGSDYYAPGGTDVAVADGGTGLSSGTSGGVLAYTATGTLASSAALTNNSPVLGGGAGAVPKVVAGIASDGTSQLQLGVAGTSVGSVQLRNATSGSITIQPPTGALGTVTLTAPAVTSTLAVLGLAQAYTAAQYVTPSALTDGANIAVNAALSNNFTVVLGGNRTLDNPTNPASGQVINIRIRQDATGTRTLAFGTAYWFPGGTDPTLSTAANAVDLMSCQYDATLSAWLCNMTKAYA